MSITDISLKSLHIFPLVLPGPASSTQFACLFAGAFFLQRMSALKVRSNFKIQHSKKLSPSIYDVTRCTRNEQSNLLHPCKIKSLMSLNRSIDGSQMIILLQKEHAIYRSIPFNAPNPTGHLGVRTKSGRDPVHLRATPQARPRGCTWMRFADWRRQCSNRCQIYVYM